MKMLMATLSLSISVALAQWQFDRSISVGSVVNLVAMLAAVAAAWGAMRSDMRIIKRWIEKHEESSATTQQAIMELRVISAKLTSMLEAANDRLDRIDRRHEREDER